MVRQITHLHLGIVSYPRTCVTIRCCRELPVDYAGLHRIFTSPVVVGHHPRQESQFSLPRSSDFTRSIKNNDPAHKQNFVGTLTFCFGRSLDRQRHRSGTPGLRLLSSLSVLATGFCPAMDGLRLVLALAAFAAIVGSPTAGASAELSGALSLSRDWTMRHDILQCGEQEGLGDEIVHCMSFMRDRHQSEGPMKSVSQKAAIVSELWRRCHRTSRVDMGSAGVDFDCDIQTHRAKSRPCAVDSCAQFLSEYSCRHQW